MVTMNAIRSKTHQILTLCANKKALSVADDKRYILDDGISTLAYGHYSITHYRVYFSCLDITNV